MYEEIQKPFFLKFEMQFSSFLHCYLFGPLSVGDGDGGDRLRVLRDILHVM